jgi:hypothetical protein
LLSGYSMKILLKYLSKKTDIQLSELLFYIRERDFKSILQMKQQFKNIISTSS